MWQELLTGIPRPLVLSGVVYVAASWFITGPLVAERMAQTRVLPTCIAGAQAKALEKSPQEQMLDELRKSPLFDDPTVKLFGLDRLIRPQVEKAHPSRSGLEAKCRCLVDQAISRSQTSWALYAGSLRLIERPDVARFGGLVARLSQEGECRE